MSEPIERDDHLRRALRHAPDADVAPPDALSEAIRRQARAAVAAPQKHGGWRRWFATPVAPWATGFAGVVVATTVALIWRLEPTPDAGEPPVVAAAPRPAADAARDDVPPASRPAPPEGKGTDSVAQADLSRTQPSGRPAIAPRAENDMAKERRSKAQPAPAPKPAAPAPPAAQAPAPAPDFRSVKRERELPAAGGTSGVVAEAGTAQDERRSADASADPSTRAVARRAEADGVGMAKSSAAPAAAQEPQATPMAAQRAPAEFAGARRLAAPALASRLAVLDADAAGVWRMRADAGSPEREIDAATRAWLSRLLRETGATWVASTSPLPDAGRALGFREAGRLAASVRLTDAGIHWRDEGSGQTWFAPLDTAQRDRLGWP